MKEHKNVFITLGIVILALAALLGGDAAWRAFRARPVPVLEETDVVLDIVVNEGLGSHAESGITIPEEYDKNQILTRLAQSEMVWMERMYNGKTSQIGDAELWISVLLENEGFMNIHLGEKYIVQTGKTVYEITDGEQLLADIKALLSPEDVVLLGEGYQTYPVEIIP